jgi:hypothetical protein
MRYAPLAVAVVALLMAANPSSAENEETTLPLHVVIPLFPQCSDAGDPCATDSMNLDTETSSFPNVFLLARNHQNLRGVQTAIDWTGFVLVGQNWACQSNQLAATLPNAASSGGPLDGTVATVFDNIVGPDTAVIGFMTFQPGVPGSCIRQVESVFDSGTHVLSDTLGVTAVTVANRGQVCAGPGGLSTCEPDGVIPVESTTWGAIKGQYR